MVSIIIWIEFIEYIKVRMVGKIEKKGSEIKLNIFDVKPNDDPQICPVDPKGYVDVYFHG